MKTFLMALMKHRKRDNSPTQYTEWEVIRPRLKAMFDHVKAEYAKWTKQGKSMEEMALAVHGMPSRNMAEKKAQELFFSLISSGANAWKHVVPGVKSAYDSIAFDTTNPVVSLLEEGHVRSRVLKHLTLLENLKFMGKRKGQRLSNEDATQVILQLNDPSSQSFHELYSMAMTGDLDYVWKLVDMLAAMAVDGSTPRFNINTHMKNGNCLFLAVILRYIESCRMSRFLQQHKTFTNDRDKCFEFLKHLLDTYDIDR